MEYNKNQVILYMFHELQASGKLNADSVIGTTNISHQTFKRYVNEIRMFLSNFYLNQELIYDRKMNMYYLR